MNQVTDHWKGLLFIGDPHLEGRIPGFRKDDYPQAILNKLRWCMQYSRENQLHPIFLGDLFHVPRDNPNWLMVELLELFQDSVLGIYGNHDVRENQLSENDSLSILVEAGRYRLLSPDNVEQFQINGRQVFVGGSSWGTPLPEDRDHFFLGENGQSLGFWVTHHDIRIDGQYDAGEIEPHEIPGVDALINGHIHRRLDPVKSGQTEWLTPGNISRRKRDEATRDHVPSVLQIDISERDWNCHYVTVPHQPFEEVFHAAVISDSGDSPESAFVTGLAELESLKTESGQGIHEFLEKNLSQFETEIADEIRSLAIEVTGSEN